MKLLILALLAQASLAFAEADAPEIIETYGDSVTAGFLSQTQATAPPAFATISSLWTDLATFVANGDRRALARLHAPELSWAQILGKKLGAGDVRNYAVSRSRARNLLGQVETSQLTDDQAVAAFFFMGHNDICHYQTELEEFTSTFRKEYEAGVAAWDAKHEGGTLYLVPVGELDRVYQLMEGYTWLKTPSLTLTCNQSWETLFPFCRENNMRRRKGTLDSHVQSRTKAIRAVLEELANEWTKRTERNNRFVFLEDVLRGTYEKEFFAVDCYHLSAYGQKALAHGVYESLQVHKR